MHRQALERMEADHLIVACAQRFHDTVPLVIDGEYMVIHGKSMGNLWEVWWFMGNIWEIWWYMVIHEIYEKYGNLWDLTFGNQTWLAGKRTKETSDFPISKPLFSSGIFQLAMFQKWGSMKCILRVPFQSWWVGTSGIPRIPWHYRWQRLLRIRPGRLRGSSREARSDMDTLTMDMYSMYSTCTCSGACGETSSKAYKRNSCHKNEMREENDGTRIWPFTCMYPCVCMYTHVYTYDITCPNKNHFFGTCSPHGITKNRRATEDLLHLLPFKEFQQLMPDLANKYSWHAQPMS